MDDTKLTVAAWAKSLGISRQAAHAAVKRLGVEVVDGRVHAGKATAVYRAMTRPRAKKRQAAAEAGDSAHISYAEAKRRTAVAEALMAERQELVQRGELGRVAGFEEAARVVAITVKEAIRSVPYRLSGLLVGRSDEREIFDLLDAEMNSVLGRISGTNEGGVGDGQA